MTADWLPIVFKLAFGGVLVGLIVRLALADIRHMILPDRLNLALGVAGVAQALVVGRPELADALLGGAVAFAAFAAVAVVFRSVRGIDGLGLGDQKFAAAAGLWIGWQEIALMMLIAALAALAFVALRAVRRHDIDRRTRVPFGPFLGLGACVTWLGTIAIG